MNTNAMLGAQRTYGVHEWVDQRGNHGTGILSQRHVEIHTARASGLFDVGHEKNGIGLIDIFNSGDNSKRNILVVVDTHLPQIKRTHIEAYFLWCKKEKLLQDYKIVPLAVLQTEKTLGKVSTVITAAKHFGLKRRDFFVAVGSTTVTDIVGFAAATYRRSTPWVLVPTDIVGVIRCSVYDNELSLNHTSRDEKTYRNTFALSHPPTASFYDPSFLAHLHEDDLRHGLAEIVNMSIHNDGVLFSYVEAHVEEMSAGAGEAAVWVTAVEGAARAAVKERGKTPYGNDAHLSAVKFGDVAVQAIEKVKGIAHDDANCVALGVALTSALSLLKGHLCGTDLGRVLNLLSKAGLAIRDETLEGKSLWKHLMSAVRERSGAPAFILPVALGKGGCLNVANLSPEDIGAALSVLRKHCSETLGRPLGSETMISTVDINNIIGGSYEILHEQTISEDVQYHVVSVPEIFSTGNTTLVHDYCIDKSSGRKRKVLVVVDEYMGGPVADIDVYFKRHSSAIDAFAILPMHVSSAGKDTDSVLRVVDVAVGLGISRRDLLIVVGGGTLMDIVGFAAAIFKGGVPYVRIPTTLVGMIDAGVGIKTGVNFENHKSLTGRYFPPVACLNDPQNFLASLPQREFACGVAEAIKMAIVKSSRLFEIIERYHRNVGYNTYTHELIHISIRTMLEELQPNLYEHDLRRLVDFGHEFGHIVESLARHEIPHGECVAIGMAISSFLAHLTGVLSRSDLERILNCILSMGLPIYVADYDCCNPEILWARIRTEGIEHKDGMLWLAVPETIGRGGFLDEITSIDAEMVSEATLSLKRYADWYREEKALKMNGSKTADPSALMNGLVPETGKSSLPNGEKSVSTKAYKPYVIVLDVGATYVRFGIMGPHGLLLPQSTRIPSPSRQSYPHDKLGMLQERLLERIVCEINNLRASHGDLSQEEVGISFGAVVTRGGVIKDASVIWGDSASGFDLKNALVERLPGVRLTILNDISAAAWRYKDEGRFCLVTVSSGLSNKVFNPDLRVLDQLDLDAGGVGGEMGHVIVEPRAMDTLVQHTVLQAKTHPEKFKRSKLNTYVHGDAQKISMTHLKMAVTDRDEFAMCLLEEAGIPHCSCGNIADLCSYSSGRGALRHAQRLAARGNYGVVSNDITDGWLQQAIEAGHPLALKVLYDSTYPLALRILQLAADIGLDKFIIVGGFAMKTGKGSYLQVLQDHLVRFCHHSAFFGDWTEAEVRGLVTFGVDDDNDGLIGIGHFVQHLRAHYRAVQKAVGEQTLTVVTRSIPRCGAQEILAKVVFSGICTTDLQILSGERGLEPTVLGHEGVCQVLEVGENVKGLTVGELIILNPNNPLDDHDKLGHTREGLFQEYMKFGQEFLERGQVLKLGRSAASATDTLIEPLSCVVAAQERIKDRVVGKNVLVIGAGLLGLLFVLMNVKMGARNVFLANRSKERLDFAVARGIVRENKAFVVGECLSSQVDEVSAGEGVDIIVICVSLGQGVRAAQDAIACVNAGGCVYLSAGFRPGDVLALDRGAKTDAWSIRSAWKTERIQVAGKPVDLSGHRGSRVNDLTMAADIIRGDSLSFGKVISHITSLDLLPDIMLRLGRNENIQGVPAKRVVIDMTARDRVVELAEELPLRHLREATRKSKDAIPMGNLFREIGFEDNTSLLGWAYPPAWQDIKATVEAALQRSPLSSKRHFIWVGTGGWVFLVDALKKTVPASQDITFHTLQSLDPKALADVFGLIENLSLAVCLGMTQSGKTLETVMLMNALRERFDSAGLDYRKHFVWLTSMRQSERDYASGEATIRSLKEHDWKKVDMMPLTIGNHPDINALFCAPYSVLMFLPLALLFSKDLKAVQRTYQQYLALRDGFVRGILLKAYSVALNHIGHIHLGLDESIAPAMTGLVTQLIEQGLGSKQIGFNPRVCVTSCDQTAGFETVAIPLHTEASAAVKIMLTMNTLSAFVALVAYHRRINFVTHPKVNLYKSRAMELMAAAEVEQKVSNPGSITAKIIAYLSKNLQTHFVEVLCYGHVSVFHRQSIKDWLDSGLVSITPSTSIAVVPGEAWNHSRYQAAVQTEDTVYVVLVSDKYCSQVEGVSKGTINSNTRTLQAIALATYETLLPKALYFRVGAGFLERK